MGSQLTSAFNIAEESLSTGGPNRLWKIYNATKKSNNNTVSLFILEKSNFSKESKVLQEEIFNSVRKEAKTLAKLRHPSILHLSEPLQEDSKLMFFVTEPVEGSLKYLIETHSKRNLIPSEIELKTQVLELIEGINFLHNSAHLLHFSISPENIYLTTSGKLKIGGFFFSQTIDNADSIVNPNIDFGLSEFSPHFGFTAPELINNNSGSRNSDTFSIGCFIYNMLQLSKNGKNLNFFEVNNSCPRAKFQSITQSFNSA